MLQKMFNFAFLLVVETVVSGYKYGSLRVVKGRDSPPDEFPYIVNIQTIQDSGDNIIITDRHCTGSVITPIWILTACHCFDEKLKMRVRYGDMSVPINVTTSYRNILETFRHPSCTSIVIVSKTHGSTISNDIALALIEEIPIKSLPRLSAVEYSSLAGVSVLHAGFGSYVSHEYRVNETMPLQVGLAGVIPCGQRSHFVPAICFVAKCSERTHPNYGDSGGPLMYEGKIVGVVSGSGLGHAVREYVMRSEATPVSPFLDWILYMVQNVS